MTLNPQAWPSFLVGPLLFEDLGFGLTVSFYPGRVVLEGSLLDKEDAKALLAALAAALPWLSLPEPELTRVELPQRRDPAAAMPSFRAYCPNLLFVPDRLAFGMGLNQPFYAARSLANLFMGT